MSHPIILFDGVCNFCNASVNFILKRDPKGFFRFAPLQSEKVEVAVSCENIIANVLNVR